MGKFWFEQFPTWWNKAVCSVSTLPVPWHFLTVNFTLLLKLSTTPLERRLEANQLRISVVNPYHLHIIVLLNTRRTRKTQNTRKEHNKRKGYFIILNFSWFSRYFAYFVFKNRMIHKRLLIKRIFTDWLTDKSIIFCESFDF